VYEERADAMREDREWEYEMDSEERHEEENNEDEETEDAEESDEC
jgi:hypothetical protein